MIELVMYGMMPSPNTAMRPSAPPENRLMRDRNPVWPCWASCFWSSATSTTGTGTCDPNRYTATISRVKRILFRRSGTRNALRKAFSTVVYGTPA